MSEPTVELCRIRCGERKYHVRDVIPEVTDALLALGLARKLLRDGDRGAALAAYTRCLNLWRSAEETEPGKWSNEVAWTRREIDDVLAPRRPMAGTGLQDSRAIKAEWGVG